MADKSTILEIICAHIREIRMRFEVLKLVAASRQAFAASANIYMQLNKPIVSAVERRSPDWQPTAPDAASG